MNKKIAGKERPYTFRELFRICEDKAKELGIAYMDNLDYTSGEDKPADDYCNLDFHMEVAYGGSEGIYACIYVERGVNHKCVYTMKTLGEGTEDFVAISTLCAHMCCLAHDYVYKHEDDFTWRGYNVGYWDGKTMVDCRLCYSVENARAAYEELRSQPHLRDKACYIRNNETREMIK